MQDEVGKRLWHFMEEKIDQNLDPEQKWFPAITRIMLMLVLLEYPEPCDRLVDKYHRDFLNKLKEKFLALYLCDREFAVKLLPEEVEVEEQNGLLVKRGFRDFKTVLDLAITDDPHEA